MLKLRAMDERTPRKLPERTGKHYCANCLKELPAEEYFAGDFFCSDCAARAQSYPLATTPNTPDERKQ